MWGRTLKIEYKWIDKHSPPPTFVVSCRLETAKKTDCSIVEAYAVFIGNDFQSIRISFVLPRQSVRRMFFRDMISFAWMQKQTEKKKVADVFKSNHGEAIREFNSNLHHLWFDHPVSSAVCPSINDGWLKPFWVKNETYFLPHQRNLLVEKNWHPLEIVLHMQQKIHVHPNLLIRYLRKV